MTSRELISLLSVLNRVVLDVSCRFIYWFWVLSELLLLSRRTLFHLFVTLAGMHPLIKTLSTLGLCSLWSLLLLRRYLILLLCDSSICSWHWCLHTLPYKAYVYQLILSLDDHFEGRLAFIETTTTEDRLICSSVQMITRLSSILRGRVRLWDHACFVNIRGEHLIEGNDSIVTLEVERFSFTQDRYGRISIFQIPCYNSWTRLLGIRI